MRYVIDGFLQAKLIEFKITERERKLLEFMTFVSGYSKTIHEVINGKSYFWLKYKAFMNEYPYLEIPNTMQVGEHVKKLQSKGIIDLYVDKTPQGTFTYVALEDKYYALISRNPKNYSSNFDAEPECEAAPIDSQLHSDLSPQPLGFDAIPTSILDNNCSDFNTHVDLNQSGKFAKSEWKADEIGAETLQNRTQKNQPTINQTTINLNNINQESNNTCNNKKTLTNKTAEIDFDLEDFIVDSSIAINFKISEEQIKTFTSWIHLRKKHHKKLINNQTTILRQLKRLQASAEFAGIDYILETTIGGSDKTGKCYENILEITKPHPSKDKENEEATMKFNPSDGRYYLLGLRVSYIDHYGNGGGYVKGIPVSEDYDKTADPFWFDKLPEDVRQERMKRKQLWKS